ncbi:GntP family permease [Helicobacter anatolicus]|uniref:GntP family permease n=1 Tax=Helicobacter anatolicus TaxID=2905874 RepID=UPI001E2CABEE|nr:GntP family permease [Helicobacter anatolicus]MCE3040496.1 GntP family permease [Helicobacter anatolicus]
MFGILLGLIVLMALAYLGWSIIWIAPIAAGVVALFGGLDLLPAYTDTYMGGLVSFAKAWFPVFMLGAIFGKLMEVTLMATSVSNVIAKVLGVKRSILGIILSAGFLTYGGVSLFVVVFAVYPLALSLFEKADIPRRLIPGTIALGAFTFTMSALPGSPQIQNLIPMKYFHTTPTAGMAMGIISGLIMLVGGFLYLDYRKKKLKAAGEGFVAPKDYTKSENTKLPNFILSIIPLIAVVVLLNIFKLDIILSLLAGIILILVFNLHRYKQFISAINDGANGAVIAIINTAAAVGFGTVVKVVPGFADLKAMLLTLGGENPLISEAIAVNVLAGATGSASGGMGIALEALGAEYLKIAQNLNISPEVLHRVASISSGGLDALPHNGAVLTLLAICGMSHKESYLDIFVVAVVIPVFSLVFVILLHSIGIM